AVARGGADRHGGGGAAGGEVDDAAEQVQGVGAGDPDAEVDVALAVGGERGVEEDGRVVRRGVGLVVGQAVVGQLAAGAGGGVGVVAVVDGAAVAGEVEAKAAGGVDGQDGLVGG